MHLLADGGISNTQIAMIIGDGALIFAIMRWRKLSSTKKQYLSDNRTITPDAISKADGKSMREFNTEMEALLSELEETSRRLTAQLDNRYTRLEQLLAEADERIAQLEHLLNASPTDSLDAQTPAPSTSPIAKPSFAAQEAQLTDAQRTLARLRAERGAPPPAQDPAYEPIYSLADAGKNPREIAQALGRQPGEIELILALRQRA